VAIIYGRAESEKELLSRYPKSVKKIEDIDKVQKEVTNQLKEEEVRCDAYPLTVGFNTIQINSSDFSKGWLLCTIILF
jgi:hypothetical protein